MAPFALKLTLLLGILLQYAPLRVCGLELATFGVNCHDRDETATSLADEFACGTQDDPGHDCVCEQPRPDGRNQLPLVRSDLDWLHVPAALTYAPLASTPTVAATIPGPEPDEPPPPALQLPLLS